MTQTSGKKLSERRRMRTRLEAIEALLKAEGHPPPATADLVRFAIEGGLLDDDDALE